jgi:hypothetical protein
MSDRETPDFASPPNRDLPDPAREAVQKPHIPAQELEREIGDSEAWDEASEERDNDAPAT